MPALQTFQIRRFGPAASTITLATKGGAVLGGVWIAAKGAAGKFTAYDSSAAVAAAIMLATSSVGVIGKFFDGCPIEGGTGLAVKVTSCTGTIFWRPSSAGV